MLKGLVLGFVCLAVTGCAFHAQKATLSPTLNVTSSDVGAGREVGLKVDDERASTSLGHRGTAYGAAAEITTDQDLASLIRSKVAEGLTSEGYRVVNYDQGGGTRLMLQLRDLKYSTSTGFWTGGVEVAGALKATASDGGSVYEKLYRTDKKTRVVVVPTAGKNQEWLNSALSDLLRQVFDDSGLSHFLTQAASNGTASSIASTTQTEASAPTPSVAAMAVSSAAGEHAETTAMPNPTEAGMREAIRAQQVATHMGCGEVSPASADEFTASCGSYGVAIDCSDGSCHPTHTIRTN